MNETYEFHCDSCGQSISVTNEQSGIQFNCPSCNAQGIVPAPLASVPAPAPAPTLAPVSATAAAPIPPIPAPTNPPQVSFGNVMSGAATVSAVTGSNPVATQTALHNLKRGKGWVMFMAVMTFIFCAAFIYIIVKMLEAISTFKSIGMPTGMLYLLALFYLVFGVIAFFQGLYLAKFSSASGAVAYTRSPLDLEKAMVSQMKFWRLTGIILCISLILMVINLVRSL